MEADTRENLAALAELLQKRLDTISDHAWRDRDQPGHLQALKTVSAEIEAAKALVPRSLDGQLTHYLDRNSFDKAQARIGELLGA